MQTAPQVGDRRPLTPKERHRRAAKRFAVGILARDLRVGNVTKDEIDSLEQALDDAAIDMVTENLLTTSAGKGHS